MTKNLGILTAREIADKLNATVFKMSYTGAAEAICYALTAFAAAAVQSALDDAEVQTCDECGHRQCADIQEAVRRARERLLGER